MSSASDKRQDPLDLADGNGASTSSLSTTTTTHAIRDAEKEGSEEMKVSIVGDVSKSSGTAPVGCEPVGSSGEQAASKSGAMPSYFRDLEGVDLPSYVRQNGTTLPFPEQLMLMIIHIEKVHALESVGRGASEKPPIGWVAEGKAFLIHDKEKLCGKWLPTFFRQAKFSSFTRKLYRWGFRQVQRPDLPRGMCFSHSCFQRDNPDLMTKMQSITAEGKRQRQNSIGQSIGTPGLLPNITALAAAQAASSLLSTTAVALRPSPGGTAVGAAGISPLVAILQAQALLQREQQIQQQVAAVNNLALQLSAVSAAQELVRLSCSSTTPAPASSTTASAQQTPVGAAPVSGSASTSPVVQASSTPTAEPPKRADQPQGSPATLASNSTSSSSGTLDLLTLLQMQLAGSHQPADAIAKLMRR